MVRAELAMLGGLLSACQASPADYPPAPGGGGPVIIGVGGGGGGSGGDAGVGGGGDGGVSTPGRVCLLSDMRKLTACATTGAGGLKVTLGRPGDENPASTTTVNDGGFSIAAPLGSGFTWHVNGANIETSVMVFGTDNTIPAILEESYTNLLESNGNLMQDDLHGSVVVRVVNGVAPVAGVNATLIPLADSDTFYDSDTVLNKDPTVWNTNHTGPNGVVWVPSVPSLSSVAITLSTTDGKTTSTPPVAVESRAITFVTQSVP